MFIENKALKNFFLDQTGNFIGRGSEAGVNKVALNDFTDGPVAFWGFASIFPRTPFIRPEELYIYCAGSKDLIRPFLEKAQTLEIPVEVKELQIPEDHKLSRHLQRCFGGLCLPSIVLGIGNRVDTGAEFFSLWFLSGMNPENALEEVKRRLIKNL